MADLEATQWKKRFERERAARKSAEKLLEDKSLEIWTINQGLEKMVEERTIQLQEALVATKAASKAKDAFLSSMSHELRTPLNAIIGFSQILMTKSDTNEGVKAFIEKIQIAGKSLLNIVNTILDFSKIEAGKMELHKTHFKISELMDEVNVLTEPMAEKKGLKRIVVLDATLDVYADRQLIKQVIVNLITNAIKFSPDGERITLEHHHEETRELFTLRDHGHGIPKEKIATLFDPFTQIREHQNESIKGTGLGLAIVKKIVELHDGEIWVESTVGEGSCFSFSLPSER